MGIVTYDLLPPAYVVRREGNSFTLFVSSHLGGGVSGQSADGGEVRLGPAADGGGVRSGPADGGGQVQPAGGGQVSQLMGGGGGQVQPADGGGQVQPAAGGGGVRSSRGGGQVSQRMGGVRSSQRGGGHVQPGGSASCALLRAVCLLRSRRRTFLFLIINLENDTSESV